MNFSLEIGPHSDIDTLPPVKDVYVTKLKKENHRSLWNSSLYYPGRYEGDVILVVNVASKCGYTYQYEGLQSLYENYKDEGLVVVGIPSRDFRQEYSEESAVAEFCSTEYGVDFPMFATAKVKGERAHPFYKKLAKESGMVPNWNFNKYLIDRNGKVHKTYRSKVKPDSELLITAIEKLL